VEAARERNADGQLEPEGPDDIRRLIVAHNAMEGRIIGLLDEKDVMLGAIGHDLETPLAALRVRIEAVEDGTERARMAATIEDINRSLDDILSLARVGRPSDPLETTELSALVTDVMGEYEDMGEDVTLEDTVRIVLRCAHVAAPRHAQSGVQRLALWPAGASRGARGRRGGAAHRGRWSGHSRKRDPADDGAVHPAGGLAQHRHRGHRAGPHSGARIADQHGGSLALANRWQAGAIVGLTATLRLPLAA
jgi:hypothetical protein